MHDFLWLTIDWKPWIFVVLLVLAIIDMVITSREAGRGSAFGLLAISIVLYLGIVWDLWDWVPVVFWLAWWIGLIAAVICAITGWLAAVARGASWVAAAIVAILVVVQAIFWPLWNQAFPGHPLGNASTEPSSPTVTPIPTPGEPNPTTAPTLIPGEVPTPTTPQPCWTLREHKYCAWAMADEAPDDNVWFTVPSISKADTKREVKLAFKFGWYSQAVRWAPLLSQLDSVVTGTQAPTSELYSGGWSTRQAQVVGDSISSVLTHASYSSDGSFIEVVLPDGDTFWVSGDTGQLSETQP
jgi:hypothetical protein